MENLKMYPWIYDDLINDIGDARESKERMDFSINGSG